MSNNNSNKKKGMPDVDPYDNLGIAFGATDSEIKKAYKKLALQYHPDKQKSDISESQLAEVSKRFQEIKDARSFLLEVDHQDARRKYDRIREGERLRKEADAIREKTMNINRKRMRDQLKEKEAIANQQNKAASINKKSKKSKSQDDELVDKLRKDGQKLRQAYAERDAQKEFDRQQKQQRKSTKEDLEERQIRLKWDRKKMSISPSEDSIATLFSENFGPVEKVEFLGSKGNQALVTFVNPSSCRHCVDEYATSKEMRAKFVGKRKEREEANMQEETEMKPSKTVDSKSADIESLHDRQLRQAAEREALLRQMEQEDEEMVTQQQHSKGESNTINKRDRTTTSQTTAKSSSSAGKKKNVQKFAPFPLEFPDDDDQRNLTPFEKLELYETKILGDILSQDAMKQMQLTR